MSSSTEINKEIISGDGTKIGYRQIGSGPGLIISHGSGRISQSYQKLAAELAKDFTVYTYDRRGRGLSGPVTKEHNILKEVDDLQAVVTATKAEYIFGHSFGGLVTLQYVLNSETQKTNAGIKKIAVYDPGVSINNSVPANWLPQFEKAIAENKKVKAMTLLLKGLETPVLKSAPGWLLMLLVNFLKYLEKKKKVEVTMLDLLQTIPADMKILIELDPVFEKYKKIHTKTLLLSGSNSQSFFQESVKALNKILPGSQLKIISDFDHYSPEERVQELSKLLKEYFKAS